MNRPVRLFLALFISLCFPRTAFSQTEKIFNTKYATVYYAQDKDIDDFIWRLGGQRLEFSIDTALASNRIDRIVERVKTILDMWPGNFHINVYLHRVQPEPNKVAFYEHKTRAVHISIDYASDGVVGHEIAHAVINQYFSSPPPKKMQEILTQYVDKYLWSDY